MHDTGKNENVSVVGLWHLGVITAAGLSSFKHTVTGIDQNAETVEKLRKGIPPIYEPGLAELVSEGLRAGSLSFTTDFKQLSSSDYVIIATDTPLKADNSSDLDPILENIHKAIPYLKNNCLLIVSSQVPVGTCEKIRNIIKEVRPRLKFGIACMPENLQLGNAIAGFKAPPLLIIGADSSEETSKAERLYWFVTQNKVKVDLKTAEMIKLALNSFMACEIGYGNELGNVCDQLGIDEWRVVDALRLDPRVGVKAQLRSGLGFSGGTIARDVIALQKLGKDKGVRTPLMDAIMLANTEQNQLVIARLESHFGSIKGIRVGVLGMTYKPGTSTIRHSVSMRVIKELANKGADVKVYDPKAEFKKSETDAQFIRCDTAYAAAESSDAMLVMTAWPEFKDLDFKKLKSKMKNPVFIDATNTLDAERMTNLGFIYSSIGRGMATTGRNYKISKERSTMPISNGLKGKVAIITGSGRGLGREIALQFAKQGVKLMLMSRTEKEIKTVAKETGLSKADVAVSAGDISNEKHVRKMVNLTLSKFGTVDILVNNAAMLGPGFPVADVDIKQWKKNIGVNIIGTFLCTRLVLPTLIKKGHGKIINTAGSGERPLPNFTAYASSKSAVIRFTETLAEEVKQHCIDVNAIAPGSISTKMTEEIFNSSKRIGSEDAEKFKKVIDSGGVPLEVPAKLALFLASDASNEITGKLISAVHDDWNGFTNRKEELVGTDVYTMRRIAPDMNYFLKFRKP